MHDPGKLRNSTSDGHEGPYAVALEPISTLAEAATLWFTGLPCSGKSTLAARTGEELVRRGHRAVVLDADVLRATVCRGLGYSKQDRDENVARIGGLCQALNQQGVTAVAAVISPYREARARLRSVLPRFVEIYVNAPLAVCMERDVKGLYARARRGEIAHFTGLDDPYEEPLEPEIAVETARVSVEESVRHVLGALRTLRFAETAHCDEPATQTPAGA